MIALADGSGKPQTEYTYKPFGSVVESGAPSANPFQFTSREDDGTGLEYGRARYYDPTHGRSMSGLCVICISIPNPLDVIEEAASQVGEWAGNAGELASAVVGEVGTALGTTRSIVAPYIESCLTNAVPGAMIGAGIGERGVALELCPEPWREAFIARPGRDGTGQLRAGCRWSDRWPSSRREGETCMRQDPIQ